MPQKRKPANRYTQSQERRITADSVPEETAAQVGTKSTCTRYEFRRVANGVIVSIEDIDEGRTITAEELVYQNPRDEDNEIESFAEFLRDVEEQFGPMTSRYSRKRIYVRVEPGDKYDGPSEDSGS